MFKTFRASSQRRNSVWVRDMNASVVNNNNSYLRMNFFRYYNCEMAKAAMHIKRMK